MPVGKGSRAYQAAPRKLRIDSARVSIRKYSFVRSDADAGRPPVAPARKRCGNRDIHDCWHDGRLRVRCDPVVDRAARSVLAQLGLVVSGGFVGTVLALGLAIVFAVLERGSFRSLKKTMVVVAVTGVVFWAIVTLLRDLKANGTL